MPDNFSANQIQGVFGKFTPVADETVAFSDDNFQGIFGKFEFVLDEAAGVVITVDAFEAARQMGSLQPYIAPPKVVAY